MRVLLDTTVVLDALRGRRGRRGLLAKILRDEGELLISVLTVAEIYLAIRPHEQKGTDRFLNSLQQLPVTPGIARLAGLLKGKNPGLTMTDALLAATAMDADVEWITDQKERYPLERLRFYRPPAPSMESLLADAPGVQGG